MPWLRRDEEEENLGWKGSTLHALDCDFYLFVEGLLTGVFSSIQGGEIEIARITHDVVFESGTSTTLFIPGATSFSPIELKRGFANYADLYNWLMQASNGHIIQARRNGSIEMRKHSVPKLRWNFYNAWPTKLASFAVTQQAGSAVSIARVSLTIAAEAIEYEDIP